MKSESCLSIVACSMAWQAGCDGRMRMAGGRRLRACRRLRLIGAAGGRMTVRGTVARPGQPV